MTASTIGSNITLLVYPSVDAISEFKVSRSNARGIFQGPLCTAVDSDGACTATGTQITDIDPVAAAYLQDVYSKIPLPPADDGLLFSVFPGVFNYREELVRVDHVVSSHLMGRSI